MAERRPLLLWLLASLALATLLRAWLRPGGSYGGLLQPPPLPERLISATGSWRRDGPAPARSLPAEVVELEAARYRLEGGGSAKGEPLVLRQLGLLSSGGSVHWPLSFSGGERCLLVDGSGRLQGELGSQEAWQKWMAGQGARGWQAVAWLAGLRPYRPNGCLWASGPALRR